VIQRQIEATDKQIDTLVYELYGLTEEEILFPLLPSLTQFVEQTHFFSDIMSFQSGAKYFAAPMK
jgi:hypothetical protein